jgi:type IV secretion system protein VirB10
MAEEIKAPEVQSTVQPATVKDKRILPEGVIPKQAQAYVVAGLALLILLAVMFSKNHAKPVPKDTASSPLVTSTDANQRKIQELEQDLSADQRQSQQAQKTGNGTLPATTANGTGPAQTTSAVPVAQAAVTPTEKPRDPVVDAERALVFKARFASNLVSASEGATRSSAMQTDSTNATAGATAVRSTEASQLATGSPSTSNGNKRAAEVNVNSAHGQPFVLFEGTIIDTALVNRLDGEFSGPVKVMVTNPVYSQDRQHVLIPEGTFILGEAQKVSGFGQKRLAVAFHRMLMPDGYSVDLDQFHGLDQVGETGLKDKVNNHYLQIFGASIALGIISGASEATTNSGYSESGSDMYRQGLASSLASSGTNVLGKFINIQPTITIREGHRIKVYISQDMLLPAYENHSMPGVM